MIENPESLPVTSGEFKKEIRKLDERIDSSVKRLDERIDSSVKKLDEKIFSSSKRLDEKIDVFRDEFKGEIRRLDGTVHRLALAEAKAHSDIAEIKETMATKSDIRGIRDLIDAFLSKLETYGRETTTFPNILDDHGHRLDDHDRRLKAVESKK